MLFLLWFSGLIQNKTKYCNIKAFYKTHGVYSTTNGTIFSTDVWISGSQVIFQYKPEAFAFKVFDLLVMFPKYWKNPWTTLVICYDIVQ